MGNLSTFGMFTMARLGIYVSQHALNVTGNNISNINTEGYTREQLDQSSMYYGAADRYQSRFDIRENGGVLATGVSQLRDQYLDIRYRNEMTKVGQMETKLSGLDQLAEVFDEVAKGEDGEGVLEARFNDFIQQLENISQPQNVGMDSADSLVRQAAEAISIQFNDYAKKLETLTQTQTAEFKDMIASANAALNKIRDLNESIRKTQIFGGSALTRIDERNLLIDELTEKIGINVTYEMEQVDAGLEVEKLVIKTESGATLVDGVYTAELSLLNETNFDFGITKLVNSKGKEDPANPNGTIVTATGAAESNAEKASVFDKTEADALVKQMNVDQEFYLNANDPEKAYFYKAEQLSEDSDDWRIVRYDIPYASDASARKASGDALSDGAVGTYMALTTEPVTKVGDTELTGRLQGMRELLTAEGEYASADDLLRNPDAGTKRGIPYYRQALDTLAREFAKAMNEANTMDPTVIYSNVASVNAAGEFFDKNGNKVSEPVLKEEYSYYNGGALFSNSGRTDDMSGITAANISVAYSWSHGSTRVLRSKEENAQERSLEQSNIEHMIALMITKRDFQFGTADEGTSKFNGTFQDMLTDSIAGTLAKDQNITKSMLSNYTSTADELYLNRDSVMGVDLNDEAMNMIMFQKAYSAACRLMTTYDGMLEKLINGTAI